jgi:hypothetical protein
MTSISELDRKVKNREELTDEEAKKIKMIGYGFLAFGSIGAVWITKSIAKAVFRRRK